MIYLFEAIWWAICILVYVLFWPAVIFAMITLILRGFGRIKQEMKEEKEKKK